MFATRRKLTRLLPCLLPCLLLCSPLALASAATTGDKPAASDKSDTTPAPAEHFKVEDQASEGSVTIGGHKIDYLAHAGTLIVHARNWDDVPQNADQDEKVPPAEASMF